MVNIEAKPSLINSELKKLYREAISYSSPTFVSGRLHEEWGKIKQRNDPGENVVESLKAKLRAMIMSSSKNVRRDENSGVPETEPSLDELITAIKAHTVYGTADWFQNGNPSAVEPGEDGRLETIKDKQIWYASERRHLLTSREDNLNMVPEDYKDDAWRKFRSLFSISDLFEKSGTYYRSNKSHVLFVGVFQEESRQSNGSTTIIITGNVALDSVNIIGGIAIKIFLNDERVVGQALAMLEKNPREFLSKLATDVLLRPDYESATTKAERSIKSMEIPTVIIRRI